MEQSVSQSVNLSDSPGVSHSDSFFFFLILKGSIMGDIMIFGQNSLNLNFEHCVN